MDHWKSATSTSISDSESTWSASAGFGVIGILANRMSSLTGSSSSFSLASFVQGESSTASDSHNWRESGT
eukprot:7890466-Prorocentrum_lima.AAC.1